MSVTREIQMRVMTRIHEAIRNRKPFSSGQLRGYITEGGSYVVASTAMVNDDDQDHDLFLILPFAPTVDIATDNEGEPAAAFVQLSPLAMSTGLIDAYKTGE